MGAEINKEKGKGGENQLNGKLIDHHFWSIDFLSLFQITFIIAREECKKLFPQFFVLLILMMINSKRRRWEMKLITIFICSFIFSSQTSRSFHFTSKQVFHDIHRNLSTNHHFPIQCDNSIQNYLLSLRAY
jgi:hypothetical protein